VYYNNCREIRNDFLSRHTSAKVIKPRRDLMIIVSNDYRCFESVVYFHRDSNVDYMERLESGTASAIPRREDQEGREPYAKLYNCTL